MGRTGAVGLSAVLAAKRLGAERIILIGRNTDRTDLERANLKRAAAEAHPHDRERYTAAKSDFVQEVLTATR